jgi:hypothetical protein
MSLFGPHDPPAFRRVPPSMFDDLPFVLPDPPAVHAGDPGTSAEALADHESSGRRDAHKRIVLGLVQRHPFCTAIELWTEKTTQAERRELGEPQEVRRRLTDLLKTGLVHQRDARHCRVKGSKMVTWEAATQPKGDR